MIKFRTPKILVMGCMLLLSVSLSGCQNSKSQEKEAEESQAGEGESENSENNVTESGTEQNTETARGGQIQGSQLTTEEKAAIEEAVGKEIETLKLVTDWTSKAVITLGETPKIEGSGAEYEKNIVSIVEGGSYELTGSMTDGMVYVETDEAVKLILNNASITNTSGPAIYIYNADSTYIELKDGTKNVLVDASKYADAFLTDTQKQDGAKAALCSNDSLVFTGTGSLSITGNYKHAISSDDKVYFEGGNITLAALTDGVHVNDGILLNDGTIEVTKANDGMESEGVMIINGGKYTAAVEDDGISVLGNLTVNDGTITVAACEEGLEANNNLVINGGKIEIAGNDDGLNGQSLVQINGGTLFVDVSAGDGLDSNGNMEITGGIVVALGANQPEGGVDCDQNEFKITGGTLIATGGSNSSPDAQTSTQAAILLGAAQKGDALAILDEAGETVFSFAVSKAYSNMLLTTSTIKEGESYRVYTQGTIDGTETFHGYYETAKYSGGSEALTFTVDSMLVCAGGTAGMSGGGGGKGNMGGGLDGQVPADGQRPQRGERPDDANFPEGMEIPSDGQVPEDGELPQDSTNQSDSQKIQELLPSEVESL